MTLPALGAVGALASLVPATSPSPTGPAGAEQAQGSFSAFLSRAATDAATTLGEAEAAAFEGVSGRASLQEVATKVMAAERTLQTAIALRDRFVASLQEISRLQI
jgi:flagellar hook-basal body complex protein FliE